MNVLQPVLKWRNAWYQLASSISRYSFFLLQIGSRASQYFRWIAVFARSHSAAGSIRAVPLKSGPVIVPFMLHGATITRGLLRMRLYFHESLRVMNTSLPSLSANQTGVRTAVPSLR